MGQWGKYVFGGLVVVIVFITGAEVYRNFLVSPIPGVAIGRVKNWQSYAATGQQLYGNPNAPVTITVFSDLQCPFCDAFAAQLGLMEAHRGNDFRVNFRNYPLRIHRQSRTAALGGICAARLGAFPKYHDAVFQRQDSLDILSVAQFARRAGVTDTTAFMACVKSPEPAEILRRDTLAAHELNVVYTPTFLVNEYRVEQTIGFSVLDQLIAIAKQEVANNRK